MLDAPSQRPATQQKSVYDQRVRAGLEDQNADEAVVSEAILHMDDETLGASRTAELPDFRLRPTHGR
jgi:hypothetical protein